MIKNDLEADKIYLIHDNNTLFQITIKLKDDKDAPRLVDKKIQKDLKVCSITHAQ